MWQCWFIGALPDSATYILREISKPMIYELPAESICSKLKKKDAEICLLEYTSSGSKSSDTSTSDDPIRGQEANIDLNKVDLHTLKIKDLKKILSDLDGTCPGCTEKSEFISKIEVKRGKKKDL